MTTAEIIFVSMTAAQSFMEVQLSDANSHLDNFKKDNYYGWCRLAIAYNGKA